MAERKRTFVVINRPRVQVFQTENSPAIRFNGCIDHEGRLASVTITNARVAMEVGLRLVGWAALHGESAVGDGS